MESMDKEWGAKVNYACVKYLFLSLFLFIFNYNIHSSTVWPAIIIIFALARSGNSATHILCREYAAAKKCLNQRACHSFIFQFRIWPCKFSAPSQCHYHGWLSEYHPSRTILKSLTVVFCYFILLTQLQGRSTLTYPWSVYLNVRY